MPTFCLENLFLLYDAGVGSFLVIVEGKCSYLVKVQFL